MNKWQSLQVLATLRQRLVMQLEYATKELAKKDANYLREEMAQRESEIQAIDILAEALLDE
jgi:hypothetical protein